jgi:hypothetical protein
MAGHEETILKDDDEATLHRIQAIQEELDRINGRPVDLGFSAGCPLEVRERFLRDVLAYETRNPVVVFDELLKSGVRLPPPDQLDDVGLAQCLKDMLHGMTLLGIYIENTDHLDDRELYSTLWNEGLRTPLVLMPENPDFAMHLDMVGSGSDEDIAVCLRYYADTRTRQEWAQRFAEENLPPHEDPPYDRDRHLPKPPSEANHFVWKRNP